MISPLSVYIPCYAIAKKAIRPALQAVIKKTSGLDYAVHSSAMCRGAYGGSPARGVSIHIVGWQGVV